MADNYSIRTDLSLACRALALHQMQEGIFNHCSAIAPAKVGDNQIVLLPPYGILWQDITPECLLGVDLNSRKVVEGDQEVSPFGICIHLPIYQRRSDVKAIMHVHSPYGTALGSLKDYRLKMFSQSACRFYDDITYHPYSVLLSESQEGEAIADSLKVKRSAILLHHGLLSVGPSVSTAFDIIYSLENACKTQILAESSGREIQELDEKICREVRAEYDKSLEEDGRKHLDAYKRHFSKSL